jgi:dihydrolipoamide dehydrogenase
MAEKNVTTRLCVLGAGPAGYAAAFRAADLGVQTTVVDTDKNPGGTCLYRGCIPSKALLHVARMIFEAREAEHFGVHFSEPKIDIARVRAATSEVVGKMTSGTGLLVKARKIDYIQGRGSFLDSNTIQVIAVNGETIVIEYEHCILATGSRPAIIPSLMPESPRVMTSTDALELPDIPPRLLVIGGGYIGLELATVYAALGSRVTIVEMTPTLLPGVDRDLVKPLHARMDQICESILLETKVVEVRADDQEIRVVIENANRDQSKATFDRMLVAVGRRPNSTGIGLDNTGVVVNKQGFVEVDASMRTADSAILAVGDLVGQPMLAHKGSREGIVAADVVAGKRAAFDAQCIPAVVYTDPEIAWVGLTETEAKARGVTVDVARFPWAASGRATTFNRGDGVTKLLVDPGSDRVLGMGIAGVGAGELISEGALAIEMGCLASDLALTIHPHPTLSETLMEAGELVHGPSTHLFRPKKAASG